MRSSVFALGFFVLGSAFTRFAAFYAPADAQTASAQTIMVDVKGAVPVVPTRPVAKAKGVIARRGDVLKLDGVNCVDCKITNGAVVQYGGGPFKLRNLWRTGSVTLELEGAALNTEALLASFGLIGRTGTGPEQHPLDSNAGALKTASMNSETINLTSPVGVE